MRSETSTGSSSKSSNVARELNGIDSYRRLEDGTTAQRALLGHLNELNGTEYSIHFSSVYERGTRRDTVKRESRCQW